jgi:6-phosphogluconolactonase (cycloisomerase 2 family)
MLSVLKILALTVLVGSNNAYWGHTFLAEGNDKVYALRSLSPHSSLCVFDAEELKGKDGVVELASLRVPMTESITEGDESCHITLLPREAVVSDYTSGTLSLFSLNERGDVEGAPQVLSFEGVGTHPTRQMGPHIHSSALSPDGNQLVVVDLGTDRIYRFAVENGRLVFPQLSYVSLPAGCGPRFSVFSVDGAYLYVVTELSDEVLVYRTSDFTLQNRYTLGGENPEGGAHIALSSDGRFLYASLRVSSAAKEKQCTISDGVAIYKCLSNGRLKKLYYQPTGGHPRHFTLSSDGSVMVVACRDSNTIEIYPLNKKTGLPTGEVEKISVQNPTYVGLR